MAKMTEREFKVKVRKGQRAKPTRRHDTVRVYNRAKEKACANF